MFNDNRDKGKAALLNLFLDFHIPPKKNDFSPWKYGMTIFKWNDTQEIKKIFKGPLNTSYWFKCPSLEKLHHNIKKE